VTAFCDSPRIGRDDLPRELLEIGPTPGPAGETAAPASLASVPLREVEKMAILQTLEACRGNRAEAARRLGISKKGIYIKMRRLGLAASSELTLV
jgi:transcriptional regulator of acetoin/glycerol metabolism